jgi:hypothetical protein
MKSTLLLIKNMKKLKIPRSRQESSEVYVEISIKIVIRAIARIPIAKEFLLLNTRSLVDMRWTTIASIV